jgi:hypothetical protein
LKIKVLGFFSKCYEIFVQAARRHVPEEMNLQQERYGSRIAGAVCIVAVVGNGFLVIRLAKVSVKRFPTNTFLLSAIFC